MASSVKHVCTICHDDGMSNEAVTWCSECEVFFCKDCGKPHGRSRLSKNHRTMSVREYQKLPSLMQEISSQCKDHNQKFELFCSFHACPCCVQCVTDKHQKCHDMKPLSDILKQVKLSASIQIFEKDLKDVKENLDTAIKYLKTRINTINIQKTKAVEEIRSMRMSIDYHINALERYILDDLESKHSNLKSNMSTLVQQMEQRASQLNEMQSQFTKMTQYATDLQVYIGLSEIEKISSQAAKFVEDLQRGDHFDERNLQVDISSELLSIQQDVKSFGDININTISSTLHIKAGRKDQAQHLVPKVPGIEQIEPSLLRRLTIPEHMKYLKIKACVILADGNIIILEKNSKTILLFSKADYFIRNVVTLTDYPHDTCFIKNNTVAVTLGEANKTALVDVEMNKVVAQIILSHACNGVASEHEMLVISSSEKSTIVKLNDMSQTILEGVRAQRIAFFKGNIYSANYLGKTVCCYKSTGEELWTFQNEEMNVTNPGGITLDKNGFVYLVSRGNNSIVVISADGKSNKTILSAADGIKDPFAIDISRETGIMVVASKVSDSANTGNSSDSDWDVEIYETVFVYKL